MESGMRELRQMKEARNTQDELDRVYEEFQKEMLNCRTEDSRLKGYKELLSSLDQEKKAHVEELRNINMDINILEGNIGESEKERFRSFSTVRGLIEKMQSLVGQWNSVRHSLGGEGLNMDDLIKQEDLRFVLSQPNVQVPQHQQYSLPPFLSNLAGRDIPVPTLLERSVFGQHPIVPAFSMLRPPLIPAQENTRQPPADMQLSPTEISGSSGIGKQQPPPMKTCTSCQQQIHRNAPICPMCKSKSRSKNPKKPKRTKPEDFS